MPCRFLVLCVLFAALAAAERAARGEEARALGSSAAVARVNGVVVSERALSEVLAGVLAVEQEAAADPERRRQLERAALESLIDFELLFQESQRLGIRIPKEAIVAELKRTEQKMGGAQAYAEALRSRGWTPAEVERDTERALAVQRLLETVVWKDVRVSDDAVAAFYERHRQEFRHPAQVRVRHILFRPLGGNAAEAWQAARRRAEEVRRRLEAGENFAELAHKESADRDTADAGGDLGWVAAGELHEEFERAALSLRVGEISTPVRSPAGYHLLQVTGRREAGIAPLEEVKGRIAEVLLRRERQRRQDEFTRQLRARAEIVYAPPSGRETPADVSP